MALKAFVGAGAGACTKVHRASGTIELRGQHMYDLT
jgi:hypothetical protein